MGKIGFIKILDTKVCSKYDFSGCPTFSPFYLEFNLYYRAVVRAWATWAQAHVLKWLIAEKMQKMGYFHCIFLIWPTSCEKPNDGPVVWKSSVVHCIECASVIEDTD